MSDNNKNINKKKLREYDCVACRGDQPALTEQQIKNFLTQLDKDWEIKIENNNIKKLYREFLFKNFKQALSFLNNISEIAEQQNHHPDLYLSWGKCIVEIWTHKINNLTESDFYLAAKIDGIER